MEPAFKKLLLNYKRITTMFVGVAAVYKYYDLSYIFSVILSFYKGRFL